MLQSVWVRLGLLISVSLPICMCQCPPFNQSKIDEFVEIEDINSTTVKLRCREGLPFHKDGSNYAYPSVSPIIAHCQPSGNWSVKSVGCWKGLFLNVDGGKHKSFAIPTERPVILMCLNLKPRQYSDVVLHLGHQQVKSRLIAWTNKTFTWKQDGIPVRCEYIAPNNTKKGTWKPIHLQYEAGFGKEAKTYTFKMGRPVVMEIPVHSKRGDIRREDVKIFNGHKEYTTFLITHNKARHLQIIVFKMKNFLPEDQGNYTIVLDQPGHEQVTHQFTLLGDPEYYSTIATTVGVAVGCTLLVVLLVIGVGCALKKYRYSKHIIGGDNNDDVFLPSRAGIRQMLIIDDEENSSPRLSAQGDLPADGWTRPIEMVEAGSVMPEVDVTVERHDEPCSSRSA